MWANAYVSIYPGDDSSNSDGDIRTETDERQGVEAPTHLNHEEMLLLLGLGRCGNRGCEDSKDIFLRGCGPLMGANEK